MSVAFPTMSLSALRRLEAKEREDRKEADLQKALKHVRARTAAGEQVVLKQVACKFNVSYSTLRRRHLGKSQSRAHAHRDQQYLSPAQERGLCDFIRDVGRSAAQGLTQDDLLERARRIAGTPDPPSRKWLRGFQKRNPTIIFLKPSMFPPPPGPDSDTEDNGVEEDHYRNEFRDILNWDMETDDELVDEPLSTRRTLPETVTLQAGPVSSWADVIVHVSFPRHIKN